MKRIMLVLVLSCFNLLCMRAAHAQDTSQVFAGYSYLRSPMAVSENIFVWNCPPSASACPDFGTSATIGTHPSLNGWELSGTYNATTWLGVTADFSGYDGSALGSRVHLQSYLFGPQICLPGPVSPFAHVLFGRAHGTLGESSIPQSGQGPFAASAFAAAVGAGIDIKVAPSLSVRAIQLDDLMTRLGNTTQNRPRVSAGLVLQV